MKSWAGLARCSKESKRVNDLSVPRKCNDSRLGSEGTSRATLERGC